MTRHPLLLQQIAQAFPAGVPALSGLAELIAQVSTSYAAADRERSELERAVATAAAELAERSRRLEDQVEQLTRLEQAIAERAAELDQRMRSMMVLLDHVAQGFAMAGLDGKIRGDCSLAFTRWFGATREDVAIWTMLAGDDSNLAAWIQLGFESIRSDLMPLDIVLDQLPRQIERGGRQLRIEYQAIGVPLSAILFVVTDITDELARRRAETAQRELLAVVDNAYRDRAGFVAFLREASAIVHGDPRGVSLAELTRRVHTLKGNAALFGVTSVAEICHEIENRIAVEATVPDAASWNALIETWSAFHDRVEQLLHVSQRRAILIDWDEYQLVLGTISDHEPALAAQLRRWSQDPTRPHLEHFADRAKTLARRLGKGELEIELHDHDLRVDGERFAPLWSALVHSVRNAVDHGIEAPDVRRAAGKPARPRLVLASELRGGEVVIEIRDDGCGIDWQAVARRAAELGLPARSRRDLMDAVFASGLSTASEVTQTSGRGLGMAALRTTCSELGGRVELVSEPGVGTTVRCCIPLARPASRTRGASLYRV